MLDGSTSTERNKSTDRLLRVLRQAHFSPTILQEAGNTYLIPRDECLVVLPFLTSGCCQVSDVGSVTLNARNYN